MEYDVPPHRPGFVLAACYLSAPVRGEIDHPLGRPEGLAADLFRHVDFIRTIFQDCGKITQVVHGHPGAMGTAFARGAFPRRRGFLQH